MKRILYFFALFFTPLFASAQAQIYVDGQPIEEVFTEGFIDVCTYVVPMTTKVKAIVDYGQGRKVSLGFPSDDRITDEEGNSIKFRSFIGVLNLFDENGFEYFGVSGGGDGYTCYLFRRVN